MIMLFFAFLKTEFQREAFSLDKFRFLIITLITPFLWFWGLKSVSLEIAQYGFLLAVLPTAAAAPVITGFLNQRIEYVTIAVLVSNMMVALMLPFALPMIVPSASEIQIVQLIIPIISTVFIPLILAQAIRYYVPRLKDQLFRFDWISFFLFLSNVYIAMAKASFFIRFETELSWLELSGMFLLTAIVCFANFGGGALVGGKNYRPEASMAAGRKNTMFGVWLALTYMSPLVSIGPMIYIICQNTYHSYLLGVRK